MSFLNILRNNASLLLALASVVFPCAGVLSAAWSSLQLLELIFLRMQISRVGSLIRLKGGCIGRETRVSKLS